MYLIMMKQDGEQKRVLESNDGNRDAFAEIVQELRMEGTASFKGMLRMEYSAFFIWTLYICSRKLSWNWENIGKRKTDSYFTFSFNWWNLQMACILVSGILLSYFLIVISVCEVLNQLVRKGYLKIPSTEEEWKNNRISRKVTVPKRLRRCWW